jgi:hypothetical protein
MIARSPTTPALQDDRPINEYFLLRLLSRSDEPGGLAAGSEDFH